MSEFKFEIEGKEVRTHSTELRVAEASYGKKTPTIRGYAAKFNKLSETMPIIEEGRKIGTFREQLMPGCFASALPVSDVRALINHDANLILGRTGSGTLRMVEDATGLAFENDPPETTYAKDIQVSMQRGDISQCSFGFKVAPNGDRYEKDPSVPGGYIRSIHTVERLFDVSVVTYPAYNDTSCAVRSIISEIRAEEEAENHAAAIKLEEQRQFEMEQLDLELQLAELE